MNESQLGLLCVYILVATLMIWAGVIVLIGWKSRSKPKSSSSKPEPFWLQPRDQHEKNHPEFAVYEADEILEQRKSGRDPYPGKDIHCNWTPGLDEETDIHGRWVFKHGAKWGVFVHPQDNKPES